MSKFVIDRPFVNIGLSKSISEVYSYLCDNVIYLIIVFKTATYYNYSNICTGTKISKQKLCHNLNI